MAKKSLKQLKVAIVHDWLYGGGAERVVYELHKMFPDAPIYTSYCSDEWRQELDDKVVTGFLQQWPFSSLRKFLPVLRIWWFGRLNFEGYDLVISSTGNGEAFGINVPEGTTHVCYCHSPTHFYWRHYDQYVQRPGFGALDPLARLGLRLLVGPLRQWDQKAAQRPDYFIANSTQIQEDIKKYYNRDSVVIFPPVDIARFASGNTTKRKGFVTMGRQVPYKRFDIVVETCAKLGVPLKVIGRGPDHDRLVQLAGPTVEFLSSVTDEQMPNLLAGAEAFLYAAREDFGIAPPEALAAGTPVITYKAGGALDYVVPGKTGEFFDSQDINALANVIKTFDAKKYDHVEIATFAKRFSSDKFVQNMEDYLQKTCL
ncbi:MAG: glycosyltransferase [Candidatus Saccharimonadales bacterium]|jgi:glycosyltransferase involved in cell wall biosynthesis